MGEGKLSDLAALGYFLLPLPAGRKEPPPAGWVDRCEPYLIPLEGNVAIGVRGEVAILITNDAPATEWATGQFGPPNVRTPRGGHWYFRARPGQANEANKTTAVGTMESHVRNKYALIPPSVHPSGTMYRWERPLLPVRELPEAPDLRDLWNPAGTHHDKLRSMSAAAARAGKDVETIHAELEVYRRAHLPDPLAHSEREIRGMAESAYKKFHSESPGPEPTGRPTAKGARRHPLRSEAVTESAPGEDHVGRRSESYLALADGRIVEEILLPNGPAFLVFTPEPEQWEFATSVVMDGAEFQPRPVPEGLRESLLLADGVEEYGSTGQLLAELEAWGLEAFDPGKEGPIFRLWVRLALASWLLDAFYRRAGDRYAPVLPSIGPPESGKGRLLLVMRYLSYRSLYLLKTTRVPSIFRALEGWGGTLILDEADVSSSSEASEFIEFLNARAHGTPIIRFNPDGSRMAYFQNFGMTILAIRKSYEDAGFNSRTVPLKAEVTVRVSSIDLVATQPWVERGRVLLRKLLLWRLRHIHTILNGTLRLPTRADFPKVEAFRARAAILPLLALKDEEPEIARDLGDLLKEIQVRLVTERADSPEGIVMGFVHDRLGAEGFDVVRDESGFRLEETRRDSDDEDGPTTRQVPLHARGVSEALGKELTIRTISRVWRAMGQTVKPRARYPGKLYASLLIVTDPTRLEREFARFVPNAQQKTSLFGPQSIQSTLLDSRVRELPEQAEHPEQKSPEPPPQGSPVQLVQDVQPVSARPTQPSQPEPGETAHWGD